MKKEIRQVGNVGIAEDSRKIGGYAAIFNSESHDLGGFIERILPGAFDGVIENSDVLALLNHDDDKGILARSKYGKGSLRLTVDEHGLYYEFESPNTSLGNELVENLKRGDIDQSSFAFTVETDTWERMEDGRYLRSIEKVRELFDVSPVYKAAYQDTSVALRKLEQINEQEMKEIRACGTKKKRADEDPMDDEDVTMEESGMTPVDETQVDEETKACGGTKKKREVPMDEEEPMDDEPCVGEGCPPEEDPNYDEEEEYKACGCKKRKMRNNNTTKTTKRMKFNLIQTINDIVNNRTLNDAAQDVIAQGTKEMRKAGLNYAGQIQLPVAEERAGEIQATVEGSGLEIVPTDKLNILEPLRHRMVLAQAGATYLTGLVGNVSIPTYDGTNVGWGAEVAAAANGKGNFGSVEYSPKRLTAYIDISKQFLNQDSVGAEEMLKMDIVNAIADKLENTILGSAAGDNTKPAGIFNGATSKTAVTYSDIVKLEENLENAKMYGNYQWIVSPKAKSLLKTNTVSGSKSDLRMIMENNMVDGYDVLSTGNVVAGGAALGKWDEFVICQWGSIDLTVDPYSVATNGCIRLVVNAYFDAKPRRPEAIQKYIYS